MYEVRDLQSRLAKATDGETKRELRERLARIMQYVTTVCGCPECQLTGDDN